MRRRRKRLVYEVRFDAALHKWVVKRRNGRLLRSYDAKPAAVDEGRRRALRAAAWWGRSQLVIHRVNNTIEDEHTYPRSSDPRRHPS